MSTQCGVHPLYPPPSTLRMHARAISLFGLLCFVALCGCRNRAYSELYLENMAAEIRELEDQLYEYDHEYRALEQELASLRHENSLLRDARARGSSESPSSAKSSTLDGRSGFKFDRPGRAGPAEPARLPADETGAAPSILEREDPKPKTPFPSDTLPAPGEDFDMDSLVPPTIEPGEPLPPELPSLSAKPNEDSEEDPQLALNLTRIAVPAQLASQSTPAPATLLPARQQLTDTRVVELAFHASGSRAINLDDRSDDDGLYLVLLPKNERGQMVPAAADLSIVVLDPAREGDAARIGRWDYSAVDVERKLKPIGSDQGIHLTLPWNGPDPAADRVIVFARYTFDNGRQVIGQKEIFVTVGDSVRTVWTARGSDSSAPTNSRVATAAAQSAAERPPTNLVRPAGGLQSSQDAPQP